MKEAKALATEPCYLSTRPRFHFLTHRKLRLRPGWLFGSSGPATRPPLPDCITGLDRDHPATHSSLPAEQSFCQSGHRPMQVTVVRQSPGKRPQSQSLLCTFPVLMCSSKTSTGCKQKGRLRPQGSSQARDDKPASPRLSAAAFTYLALCLTG